MITTSPHEVYQEYLNAKQYNAVIDLEDRVKTYEDFFIGKQWEGVNAPDMDKPVFNILKRVVNYFIAMLAADDIGISIRNRGGRNHRANSALHSALKEQVLMIMEENKYSQLTRRMLRDAAVDGDGCVHLYYEPGEGMERGRISCELINNTDVFFGNPYVPDVERQPYIIIATRRPVESVRAEMRNNGFTDDVIEDAFSDDALEADGGYTGKRCTVLTKYYKQDGRVWFVKTVRDSLVKSPECMNLRYYPVCYMNWERVKGSYHGVGAIEGLIPNQIAINKMAAMAQQFIRQQAFPKIFYNRNKLKSWTGGLKPVGVAGDPSDILYSDKHERSMSSQVGEYIDKFIGYTKELMGASDAALGSVTPHNTSAIIAVQKATAVPLELIKQEYYNFTEDFVRICIDMMSVFYGVRKLTLEDEGEYWDEYIDFKDFDSSRMKLNIDIGAASYWSEMTAATTLDHLYKAGLIDSVSYLEGIPQSSVPNKNKLIEEAKKRKEDENAGKRVKER